MILYVDTSAFLKLYLEEPESNRIRQVIAESSVVCAHLITYAEMRAALAQAMRMKRIPEADLPYQVRRFEDDWLSVEIIAADEPLVRRAGDLAERFALRGYDSLHLAAAERVYGLVGGPAAFAVAVFDNRLRGGIEALGLPVAY